MIATILMVIVFLSFSAMVAYNVMSFNHNITVSNDITMMDNELNIIKQKLIADAKPIISSDEYALAYGVENGNNHELPSHLSLPVQNIKGFDFLYCPYGFVDSTVKNETVTQNDSSAYNVKNISINGQKYTAYSDSAVTFSEAPEVNAFIVSKLNQVDFNCSDIKYDINSALYYSQDVKIKTITKDEVSNYFRFNDLSGRTEELTVDNLNITETLSLIENDESNKSYEIVLSESVDIDRDFNFKREANKKSNIHFELSNYKLKNSHTFEIENISLSIKGTSNGTSSSSLFDIEANNSNINIKNATVGGIDAFNTNISIEDATISSNSTQKTLHLIDSKISALGNNKIIKNSSGSANVIELKDSSFVLAKGLLEYGSTGFQPQNGIALYNSQFSIYGNTKSNYTTNPNSDIFVSNGSTLYLNGANVVMEGQLNGSEGAINISGGKIASSGSPSTINIEKTGVDSILKLNGASALLDDIKIGNNGIRTNDSTIVVETYTQNEYGVDIIKGDNTTIYGNISKCWSGEIFKNKDLLPKLDLTNSGSDQFGNSSNWNCSQ